MMSRNVLITGASTGIGLAIAQRLIEDDHNVVGMARDFTKTNFEHPNFITKEIDLSRVDKLPEMLKNIDFPTIDTIVINAGKGLIGHLEQYSYRQIQNVMDLNFMSGVIVVKFFISSLKRLGRGDIIFIGSTAGLSGKQQGSIYCASKFALRGFAQSLREEVASTGIRVCMINPGMVKTNFFDELDIIHGDESDNYLLPEDIAETISTVLAIRKNSVIDEITLSPQKKVVQRKNKCL